MSANTRSCHSISGQNDCCEKGLLHQVWELHTRVVWVQFIESLLICIRPTYSMIWFHSKCLRSQDLTKPLFCIKAKLGNQQTNWVLKMWYSSCYKEFWRISRGQRQKSEETFLRVSSLRDQKKSSKDLAQHLPASSGYQVDPSNIWKGLIRNGLCGRVVAKIPLFREGNRIKRLLYVRRVGERCKNECLWLSLNLGGGSVQVWGCISARVVADIVRIDELMNECWKVQTFFSIITIPNTLLMQWNHIRREIQLIKHWQ